ncbi:MAG: archaemetzincin family Zn-dependent metalloprotease [Terriglobia bacterium]|jgi:archaemetzincin
MRIISLMPVGQVDRALLEPLAASLTQRLRVACSIQPDGLEAEFAFNPLRRQYHSTEILKKILQRPASEAWRVLGVTEMDLYIPVLTFVFGEAQLSAVGAVVSTHRLRQEFYGMPTDPELLRERLLKESLHELGHTYGLRHCPDYSCVMSASNGVERIDLKRAEFCPACAQALPASGS